MATIHIEPAGNSKYRVSIDDRGKTRRFTVTATPEDVARYAPEGTSPERLIHASFEFLLAREPASSILSSFALPVIENYFPDYPTTIKSKL
ncbi:MAG TPA: hypothetical protein VH436_11145 [Vicinamibacterales bacterium]|jgi:hypothetical protein